VDKPNGNDRKHIGDGIERLLKSSREKPSSCSRELVERELFLRHEHTPNPIPLRLELAERAHDVAGAVAVRPPGGRSEKFER
jgi:hypothetical protein